MVSFWLWYRPPGVAELVDARDLKSLGLGHPGSSPGARTIVKSMTYQTTRLRGSSPPRERVTSTDKLSVVNPAEFQTETLPNFGFSRNQIARKAGDLEL